MKGNKMLITKIQNNVFRLVLGSNENDTYYVAKSYRGTWKIANGGQVIDFAPTRQSAINRAVNLFKEVTA